MLRPLIPSLRQAAGRYLDRGRSVLARGATIVGLALVGGSLALAAAVMALASLVGPVAACGLAGLSLLSTAVLLARNRRTPVQPDPVQPSVVLQQHAMLVELGFVAGFVLSRAILRRFSPSTMRR